MRIIYGVILSLLLSCVAHANTWVNVKSVAPTTCAAAVGNGVTDDTAAIQCHLDYIHATPLGGHLFFPAGDYLISGAGLTSCDVYLEGDSEDHSIIKTATNTPVITLNCNGGLEHLFVLGYEDPSAAHPTVTTGINSRIIIRDTHIWYGSVGLFEQGVDGLVENAYISGYWGAVYSTGANWYVRDKFDTAGITSYVGFYQDSPGAGFENRFVLTDFSGSYTYSVWINDPTQQAVTVFQGSVFPLPIRIDGARWTAFSDGTFSNPTFAANAGVLTLTGNYSLIPIAVTGAATRMCENNYQITC